METALLKGDRVFVNKLAYGIRLPMTVLSIPFSFDSFWGFKSYSSVLELKYRRVFKSRVERNDIVLFNNPIELDKPLDKRSLILSRCVALPGDTIRVKNGDFFINEKKYVPSPNQLMTFRFKIEHRDSISSVMSSFSLPQRNLKTDSIWSYISLNQYEMYIINQKLPSEYQLKAFNETNNDYALIVPYKGQNIRLNPSNTLIYDPIILQESPNNTNFSINGVYEFQNDYYWFISDNSAESLDSRTLGFISEKDLIGKVSFVWFSFQGSRIRWNRVFSSVK